MASVLSWSSFIFVILGLCTSVNGALSLPHCPDSNLSISGGSFTLSKMYNDGSILRYICLEGYYPYPVNKRQCNGVQWDPAPTSKRPMCKKVTCPNPNVLKNGVVHPYKTWYHVNDTTTYRCNSDYTFRGSSKRVCQVNGKWSGGTPVCSRDSDHCPDPGIPPGASREGHIFNIDDKVTYRCDNKLKLLGSKVRMCQDNGQWSGKEPECYADFTYDTPEEVAEAFGSSLKTTLTMNEETGKAGKRIHLIQNGNLDIYIALDASDSIDEDDFNKAKEVIKTLITKISYYEVFPNYEIIIFATDVTKIVNMADYKRLKEKNMQIILKLLDDYNYDTKGQKSGTNIARAYGAIQESISFEKARNMTAFNQTQHVIIMFTDGISNMGGNPKPKVEEIKETVYNGDVKREKYLDLYAFGVGDEVMKQDLDEWVTKRDDNEKHIFLLKDMENVQETLDEMIDESTSVSLCGLYRDYDDGLKSSMRLRYPWLIKIFVTHEDGKTSNCLGSLVTPKFILTAAHCFRFNDIAENIKLEVPNGKDSSLSEVKHHIPHPKYNRTKKVKDGISEYYEYDVALIELNKGVKVSPDLRTICIPCTHETHKALKLSDSDATCKKHAEVLLNSDGVKAFFMSDKKENVPKRNVIIKQGAQRDQCLEDAKKTLNITKINDVITDNFLCTGGAMQNQIDDVSCKGDSGGATFVEQKYRVIQVGIVSWGLKDVCKNGGKSDETARDFHINLFSPKVQEFLKKHLVDGKNDIPLTFL